jgi:hypothetical protein
MLLFIGPKTILNHVIGSGIHLYLTPRFADFPICCHPYHFLPINFPPMSDTHYSDLFLSIINFIDNTIIPYPNPPITFGTGDFSAALRPWFHC